MKTFGMPPTCKFESSSASRRIEKHKTFIRLRTFNFILQNRKMKILFLPIAVILVPIFLLGTVLIYWKKSKNLSIGLKIALGLASITIGIMASVLATFISIKGMREVGIEYFTGAIIFVPLGLITYIIMLQKNNQTP